MSISMLLFVPQFVVAETERISSLQIWFKYIHGGAQMLD